MSSFKKILYNCSLVIFIVFAAYISFQTLRKASYTDFINVHISTAARSFLVLSGAVLLCAVLWLLLKMFEKLPIRGKSILLSVCAAFIIAGQIAFLAVLRPQLSSDMHVLVNEALALLDGKKMTVSDYGAYFAHFPNNHFPCIFTMLLLKLAGLLSVSYENYVLFLQFANLAFTDLALVLAYFLIGRLKNKKTAAGFIFLAMLFPMTYLLPAYYYTSTMNMPLTIGLLYLLLVLSETDGLKKQALCSLLLGILFYIAMKIRATAVIVPIAFVIWIILSKKATDFSYKKVCCTVLPAVIIFFLCIPGYGALQRKYVDFEVPRYSYPVTYWLMMGVHGGGTYNYEDDLMLGSIEDPALRKETASELFAGRLREQGASGLYKLGKQKLETTWSGGLYDYFEYLTRTSSYPKLADFIVGSRKDFFVLWMRAINLLLFALSIAGAGKLILEKELSSRYLLYLCLLGGIFFQLLWETGAIYGIPFLIFLLVAAGDGLGFVTGYEKADKTNLTIFGVAFVYFIFTLIRLFPSLTGAAFENIEFAAYQDLTVNETGTVKPFLRGTLQQDFRVSRSFNCIGLCTSGGSSENNAVYRVCILNAADSVLAEMTLLASDASYMTSLQFDTITPDGTEQYSILIEPLYADKENNLTFLTHDTGYWDTYPAGNLKKDGREFPTADLAFEVFLKIEKPFIYI